MQINFQGRLETRYLLDKIPILFGGRQTNLTGEVNIDRKRNDCGIEYCQSCQSSTLDYTRAMMEH